MFGGFRVGVVVPARDEQDNIGLVVRELLALRNAAGGPLIDDFVVCDNGSKDATGVRGREAGARVVRQDTPGYGIACLSALAALQPVEIVLFTDGDRSFVAAQALRLLQAIAAGADLAIGSRTLGRMAHGALSRPQILGNRLAAWLIWMLWRHEVTDLGPYRAIRTNALQRLGMRDRAYGWTLEMQVKAIQHGLKLAEVPVDTMPRRFGKSKVGGTLKGVVGAGWGILSMLFLLRWRQAVGEGRPERRTGRRKRPFSHSTGRRQAQPEAKSGQAREGLRRSSAADLAPPLRPPFAQRSREWK